MATDDMVRKGRR